MPDEAVLRAELLSMADDLAERIVAFRDRVLTSGWLNSVSINVAGEVVREIDEDLAFMASKRFKSGRLAEIEVWLELCTESLKDLYGLKPSKASVH